LSCPSRSAVAAVSLALAACAHQHAQSDVDDDAFSLYIEVSYPYQMLDRTRELAKLIYDESSFDTRKDARAFARTLRETVWEYNAESSSLCADGLYAEWSCLPALDPPWLGESPKVSPSPEELRRRLDLVQGRLEPLWRAACADFDKRHPNASPEERLPYCSIE
jgi:hypothetical protein